MTGRNNLYQPFLNSLLTSSEWKEAAELLLTDLLPVVGEEEVQGLLQHLTLHSQSYNHKITP